MGLCFVGERANFGDFICSYSQELSSSLSKIDPPSAQYTSPPDHKGYLVDVEGNRLGEHKGLWYYTIGQGARLGGMDIPHFVAKKGVGSSGQDILVVPGSYVSWNNCRLSID